jgi:hypothetical protein
VAAQRHPSCLQNKDEGRRTDNPRDELHNIQLFV